MRRDVVEEALIVRDDDGAATIVREELLEPADREDVEVVRRLVEQEDVGTTEQHLRQEHAQLEAARERRERIRVERHGDAETLEDVARARFERVAVVRGDAILELGELFRIGRARRNERLLLGERSRDELVARHRDVDDALLVGEEAILPQHADAGCLREQPRNRRSPVRRRPEFAGTSSCRSRSRRRGRSASPRRA